MAASTGHESEIVESVLMLPVDDVVRAVTPGGTASTMPIDTFINAFKKPLQQPILSSPPRLRITKIPGKVTMTMKDLSPRGVHALQQRASSEPKNLKRGRGR